MPCCGCGACVSLLLPAHFVLSLVRLHPRLLACNFSQFIVIGVIIFFANWLFLQQRDLFYSREEKEYQVYVEQLQGKMTVAFG